SLTFLPPGPSVGDPNPFQTLPDSMRGVLTPGPAETRVLSDGTQQRVTSYIVESKNAAALQVEINCMLGGGALNSTDLGSNTVKIWGWPPAAVADVGSLNNWVIRVQAGFDKQSLPLGKKLAMLSGSDNAIIEGQIIRPFGNAVRPEFTVTLPIARTVVNEQVQAIGTSAPVFSGRAGEQLSAVLARTFAQYYPSIQPQIVVSDNVVLYEDLHHAVSSIQDLADLSNNLSRACMRSQFPSYPGILSRFVGNTFVMSDVIAPRAETAKPIRTIDMIGPPQYVDNAFIHVSTPMRADIRCFDIVEITAPTGAIVSGLGAAAGPTGNGWPRNLQGKFQVMSVQHLGNNRSPDGTGWASHFLLSAKPITQADYGKPLGSQGAQAAAPQAFGTN
ncbi:hypothetical protein, partial [Burkholderia cenocepacia]|uniref:hypothetical protein n=1 Tax=Burkholderia cenocepacia TaxID=95486 RepID=UPI002AB7E77D